MWVGSRHWLVAAGQLNRRARHLQVPRGSDTLPRVQSSSHHRLPGFFRSCLSLGFSRGRGAFFSSRSASMLLPFCSVLLSCVRRQPAAAAAAAPDSESGCRVAFSNLDPAHLWTRTHVRTFLTLSLGFYLVTFFHNDFLRKHKM